MFIKKTFNYFTNNFINISSIELSEFNSYYPYYSYNINGENYAFINPLKTIIIDNYNTYYNGNREENWNPTYRKTMEITNDDGIIYNGISYNHLTVSTTLLLNLSNVSNTIYLNENDKQFMSTTSYTIDPFTNISIDCSKHLCEIKAHNYIYNTSGSKIEISIEINKNSTGTDGKVSSIIPIIVS